jgi:hypothetical protein
MSTVESILKELSEAQAKVDRLKADLFQAMLKDPAIAKSVPVGDRISHGTQTVRLVGDAPIVRRRNPSSHNGTSLRHTILEIADTFQSRFTAEMVRAKLEERQFKFNGKPKTAVRDAMYAIVKNKLGVRVAGHVKGTSAKYYERVQ